MQVEAEYALVEGQHFVSKRLHVCQLQPRVAKRRRECDENVNVDVVRQTVWDGLHRVNQRV